MRGISLILALALVSGSAFATIIRVGPGQPWTTIQAGIDASISGDTVLVEDGVYTGSGNKNLDFSGRNIMLMSESGPENCIIDCDTSGRGFFFHSGEDSTAIVEGLTIKRGRIIDNGGCIKIINSSPSFKYCIFTNNSCQGYYGGGAYILSGSPSFLRCTFYGNAASTFGGAIYAVSSDMTINTCILSGNIAHGCGANISGIYCSSGNPTIIYNDFWNDYANFYGAGLPFNIGVISQVNINGDPCDRYNNIFLNPRMISLYTGDLHLQENSPCIDAGDPQLPLDPDNTIADMGALYYFQSLVFIVLTPRSSFIIIPGGGGSFSYDAELTSNYHEPYTFDAWVDVILPSGNIYGPVMSRSNMVIPVGGVLTRTLTQYVPSSCPSGFLYLVGKVGFLPDSVVDSDEVPFMKLMDDGSAPSHNQGWSVYGWDNEVSTVSEFGLLSPYPNPFNPQTQLTYTLSESGNASLVIYDVQGKEITRLAQGWHFAGSHQVAFDASGLSSGVYFARLEAKGLNQTQKLLLVK